MSELEQASAEGSQDISGTHTSAGAMLRQAREASGLHIAALAVSLKVPVKKLEALEADRFDLLPDAVFVRALASSVCRTLKVDPAPILGKLPQTAAPRLAHVTSGINAPFRAPSDGPGPSTWDQVSRPAVLAVLALLMGALVLIFLPDIRGQMSASGSAPEAAVMPPPAGATPPEAPVQGASLAGAGSASPEPGSSAAMPGAGATSSGTLASSMPAATTATLQAPVALSPSASLSTPTVASPTLVITPGAAVAVPPVAAEPGAQAAATAAGIVVFKAKGESWVEVTDAKGTVSLRKTLAPGEAAGASGALPLSVVVGRADSTQVQVRGKLFDLAPLSRDNVARFEVK